MIHIDMRLLREHLRRVDEEKRLARATLADPEACFEEKQRALFELADYPLRVRLCRELEPDTLSVVRGELVVGLDVWKAVYAGVKENPMVYSTMETMDGELMTLWKVAE